jgi:hypothetical protein
MISFIDISDSDDDDVKIIPPPPLIQRNTSPTLITIVDSDFGSIIFSYLALNYLITTVRYVCKSFNNVISNVFKNNQRFTKIINPIYEIPLNKALQDLNNGTFEINYNQNNILFQNIQQINFDISDQKD